MKNEIHTACTGHKVSIYVKTVNYIQGEIINLEITEVDNKDIKKGIKKITVSGTIKEDGSAELNEILEIEKI